MRASLVTTLLTPSLLAVRACATVVNLNNELLHNGQVGSTKTRMQHKPIHSVIWYKVYGSLQHSSEHIDNLW